MKLVRSAIVLTALLPTLAGAQGGYPARATLLDCRLDASADQRPEADEGARRGARQVGIFLTGSQEPAIEAGARYLIRGVSTSVDSALVQHDWPSHFVIEQVGTVRGIHGEHLGRAETTLRIGSIDERQGRAQITLTEKKEYGSGPRRVLRDWASGSCRIVTGAAALAAFEGIEE